MTGTDKEAEPPEKRPNRLRRGGLFIKDEELIERLGVPEKVAREALHALDKNAQRSGFPQKIAFWGGRRYWPAVLAYLDYHHGFKPGRQPATWNSSRTIADRSALSGHGSEKTAS